MSNLPDGQALNPEKWKRMFNFFKTNGENASFTENLKKAISSVIKEQAHAKAEYIRGNISKSAASQAGRNLENAIIDLRTLLGYFGVRPSRKIG